MGFYQYKTEQVLNASIDQLWEFISHPKNLQKIAPKKMGFVITSQSLDAMYPGMIISYKLKPLLGIPTTWVTEITHVELNKYFVDEQRIGPFAMWHHEHIIEPLEDGRVMMRDIVSYSPPFGFLGRVAHWLFLKSQVVNIFDYRKQALSQEFNT